jgi:carbon monoxide dehydrogenase subunit G
VPNVAFEISIPVQSDPAKCWEILTDVPLLASWVTILHDVQEQSRMERYSAVLLDVKVSEVVDAAHIRVQAAGEDRQVSSRIGIDATLTLDNRADGATVINVVGSYEVVGKVATLGAGMIKQKANKIIDEFSTQAAAALGSV